MNERREKIFISILCLIFSILISPVLANDQAPLSKSVAFQIVLNDILGGSMEGKWVYAAKEAVKPETEIKAFNKIVKSPSFDGWFFFIDDHPWANWEHSCRYVFVNTITGEYQIIPSSMPPDNIHRMERLTSIGPVGVKKKAKAFSRKFILEKNISSCSSPENLYAIIISGGYNPYNNWVRYWNDCAAIYSALTQVYGYPDDHIYVIMSDGTDPGLDRHHYDDTYDSSPLDLDEDGDDDIQYSATKANIANVFNALQAILDPEDSLFIYTTDHGSQEAGQDALLLLWEESIKDDEFAIEVNKINCGEIMVVMEQCHSGGFVDDLSAQGRVIATACAYDESSWAMPPDYLYDEFVYYWTEAVRGETPDHTPVDADADGDGNVSMEEAFTYARDQDTAEEEPQYDSIPPELGAEVSLCGDVLATCEEDDSGDLDIMGNTGGLGGTVAIPVRIQGAPNEVESLGFEVTFNHCVLEYTGFTRGPLVENFDYFEAFNPETGIVRVGGFEAGEDTIPTGANGDVIYLNFNVIECEQGSKYTLDLQKLKDDIAGWSASLGCFQCGCSCDVNGDGEVTPKDALCAFQTYLGICPTDCGECEDICCDVNMDNDCTPADALEIFKEYLGLPSVCSQ